MSISTARRVRSSYPTGAAATEDPRDRAIEAGDWRALRVDALHKVAEAAIEAAGLELSYYAGRDLADRAIEAGGVRTWRIGDL